MIGRGGMGSVWQATHLGLDIPCAVKFIEGELSNMAEAQTRFEREAKAAAQLRSPHVVQILDHGVCDGTPYIAMELLDGEDVGKRLQRLGKIHPRDINTIITQVCRALTKAHAVGIVHRDLKPDNIFLVRDDEREIAKVLDFGIAKSASNALEGSNTKTGAMLGTPYYMSPEQAQGTKKVDYRSDLWSLAVIVFQCLTGPRYPSRARRSGELLGADHRAADPDPVAGRAGGAAGVRPLVGAGGVARSERPVPDGEGVRRVAAARLRRVAGDRRDGPLAAEGDAGGDPQPGDDAEPADDDPVRQGLRTPAASGAATPAPGA